METDKIKLEDEVEKDQKPTTPEKEVEKDEPLVTNSKSSSNDDYCLPPPPIQTTARGGRNTAATAAAIRPKGRLKRQKKKRVISITGLDFLHTQTLLSTSPSGKTK